MYATIKFIFTGLSWFFASLAIIFYIYFVITNPGGFFSNVFNPLILVYLFPSIACYWVADWADRKSITKYPEKNKPETSSSGSSYEMQQDQELPLDHSHSFSTKKGVKRSPSGVTLPCCICLDTRVVTASTGAVVPCPECTDVESSNDRLEHSKTKLKTIYGGVVFGSSDVLIINPSDNDSPNTWVFPCGPATKEESPEEAALRHVYEYTGLQAEIIGRIVDDFIFGDSARRYFLMKKTHKFEQEVNEEKTRTMFWLPVKIAKDTLCKNANENERRIMLFHYLVQYC